MHRLRCVGGATPTNSLLNIQKTACKFSKELYACLCLVVVRRYTWIQVLKKKEEMMKATKCLPLLMSTHHFAVVTLALQLARCIEAFRGPRILSLPWTQQQLRVDTTKSSSSAAAATAAAAVAKSRASGLPLQMSPIFNFEAPTNRSDTGSIKWDNYGGKDVIPMWVRIG